MWNNLSEAGEPPRASGYALWVALLLFVVIVLSNLLMVRPRLTDRFDVWSTRVMQAEYTARMLYGNFLPVGAARRTDWDDALKLLTTKDAPLGALVRAVVLLDDQAGIMGQKDAQQRIDQLLQRMPHAPTQFSPQEKQAILRWCLTVYGERRRPSAEEKERFRRTIERANLGWMRLLALKHLEFLAGDTESARRWDVQAREEANRLQYTLVVVFAIVALLMLAGVGTWLAYAVWKSSTRSNQPALPLLSPRFADAVLWALVAYFAATYLGGWVAGAFAAALPASTPLLVVLVLLVQVATGGVALWWLYRQMKQNGIEWRDLGLTGKRLSEQIAWGTAAYVAMIPVLLITVVLVQVLLPTIPSPAHPIAGVASSDNPRWVVVLLFLVAAVFAPLFEEVFFRGVLLNAVWALTGNRWIGIIASALVFSVLHPQMYLGWIAVFVIGLMLGALFVERRSLLPCIWMHALNNGLALFAAHLLRMTG
ncbi:MAG: CPBP family intramembrane glutamic endopeptidase [Armatimonadota bacterium]|nr:CPBP family intramembrane metalloprotease [bacterium]MDW8321261.1 CPBP family intramembrane glutamic endopeptidase [Armatimonadota bacterium]